MSDVDKEVKPWSRVVILVSALIAVFTLSKILFGSALPSDPSEALIIQNALLLIVLGSALVEHLYTKPVDSVVNSLMAILSLLGIYHAAPRSMWIAVSTYCVFVLVAGIKEVASKGWG